MGQYHLFALTEAGELDQEQLERENRDVDYPQGRWERWYTEKWIDALVIALTQPVRVGGETGRHTLEQQGYRIDVEMERIVRLAQIGRRHSERLEQADEEELEDLYRELGHEWKEPANTLTNWEVCLLLMEASMVAPLSREGYEEYKRAFAHCFGQRYRDCFGQEPIDVDTCRMARWRGMPVKHQLPKLDDEEVAWIARFNAALQEPSLLEELFQQQVEVVA